LRALVPLLDTLPEGAGRARGVLRALRYAAELGDDSALTNLCARWSAEPYARAADMRRLLVGLSRSHASAAAKLAEAEVERTRGQYEEASARYAYGRCLETRRLYREALLQHEAARRLATDRPQLADCAGVRAVRVLLILGEREEAARRAARLLPLERGVPADRLAIAVAALDAPGRYRRAAALDVLETLARNGGEIGRAAVAFAAFHAECAGEALSSIEVDRIEAVLAQHRDVAAAAIARERLRALALNNPLRAAHTDIEAESMLVRARAVAEGGAPGPRPNGTRAELAWIAYSSLSALTQPSPRRAEARDALTELLERVRRGARIEAPIWTAAIRALDDPTLREHALSLAAALLARSGEPPPRGFACLAEALDAAGSHSLAIEAWRRAAARREPNAKGRLAAILRHRGWVAADRNARDEAIALLREARRLAGGTDER
jgi:hypothetical protein